MAATVSGNSVKKTSFRDLQVAKNEKKARATGIIYLASLPCQMF
jgi:hypothetical protein